MPVQLKYDEYRYRCTQVHGRGWKFLVVENFADSSFGVTSEECLSSNEPFHSEIVESSRETPHTAIFSKFKVTVCTYTTSHYPTKRIGLHYIIPAPLYLDISSRSILSSP